MAAPTRRTMAVLIIIGALIIGLIAAVVIIGPWFGIYLIKPSVKRYVEHAATLMEQGYYATGPEWEAAKQRLKEETAQAQSFAGTRPALQRAIKVAGGKHSFVMTPEQAGEVSTPSTAVPTFADDAGVTTIVMPELGATDEAFLTRFADTAADGIASRQSSTCGWIIDLRENGGGNMWPMIGGLAALLPDGTMLSFRSRTNADAVVSVDGGSVTLAGSKVQTREDVVKDDKPVAVLYSAKTASSGEAVAAAFLGLDKARSFGEPTAGYTSANQPLRLYDGTLLQITTSMYIDRTGKNLEQKPITPDESTKDALASAKAWLAGQGCR